MPVLAVTTWNINSVRLRADQVSRFLAETEPDVLCLQETKCSNDAFPVKAFEAAGYPHLVLNGRGGTHGVAIASKHPLEPLAAPDHCMNDHPRVAVARVRGVEIHNYYVPAGGDEPDPDANDKFAHKLDFVARMGAYFEMSAARFAAEPVVITGDLNIAPGAFDVWSHKQLLKVVSHTPVETLGLTAAREAGGLTDLVRLAIPEPTPLFTWWSYRSRDWRKSNRGRRLDHVWGSPQLVDGVAAQGEDAVRVDAQTRDWDKPSDHIPVTVRLNI